MTRNVFRCYKRLIGPVATTTLMLLAAAGTAWGQPDEVTKLLASDAAALDDFGFSLSIDGDTAVVGARSNDDNGSFSGSAYIFQQDHGGADNWGEVEILLAEDGFTGDQFGYSVSISGDFAIVGARLNDDDGDDSGSAYIFYRHENGINVWGQLTKITASDAAASDSFGVSVSINGGLAVIGATGVGSGVGAAYIFERDGAGDWNEVAILSASDGATDDLFGVSVSISGDTAIVGAWGDDDNGAISGSAYIFQQDHGGTDNWGQVEKLTASDGAMFGFFGTVAISIDTAVVGAFGANTFAGKGYIFERDAGGTDNWGQTARLTASDANASDQLGISVSIRGEGVILGANQEGINGSAYLFREPSGGWQDATQDDKITASDGAAFDRFGVSVSISGDLAIVGAHFNDDACPADPNCDSGSAYIFDGVCPCPWDLNGDGSVGALDLVDLLANWGPCGDCDVCPWDFDANCSVGASDLLAFLVNWGLCPCVEGTPPPSLEDEMAAHCLTMDDWDAFEDKMQNGTEAEKENYLCWILHYLEDCSRCFCVGASGCPDDDPFNG